MSKCYMCDAEATSVEHAPAKGFFPVGLRNNLITVPSCATHNEDTSADDEYARNRIVTSLHNNPTAHAHFMNKVFRSFQGKRAEVIDIINSFQDASSMQLGARAYELDRSRVDRVIRKAAYALFYKKYGVTWNRALAAATDQFKNQDLSLDHLGEMYRSMALDLSLFELEGNNPLVFQYAFIEAPDIHASGLFMVFYGGFPFLMIPDPTTVAPSLD
jgi:hypothetical protein